MGRDGAAEVGGGDNDGGLDLLPEAVQLNLEVPQALGDLRAQLVVAERGAVHALAQALLRGEELGQLARVGVEVLLRHRLEGGHGVCIGVGCDGVG